VFKSFFADDASVISKSIATAFNNSNSITIAEQRHSNTDSITASSSKGSSDKTAISIAISAYPKNTKLSISQSQDQIETSIIIWCFWKLIYGHQNIVL
jgi:hypothetical protein